MYFLFRTLRMKPIEIIVALCMVVLFLIIENVKKGKGGK